MGKCKGKWMWKMGMESGKWIEEGDIDYGHGREVERWKGKVEGGRRLRYVF
jgi:hypothetical protein